MAKKIIYFWVARDGQECSAYYIHATKPRRMDSDQRFWFGANHISMVDHWMWEEIMPPEFHLPPGGILKIDRALLLKAFPLEILE
jgi:hypothetical protein